MAVRRSYDDGLEETVPCDTQPARQIQQKAMLPNQPTDRGVKVEPVT